MLELILAVFSEGGDPGPWLCHRLGFISAIISTEMHDCDISQTNGHLFFLMFTGY